MHSKNMYIVEFKGVLVDELRLTVDMKQLVRRVSPKFIAQLDSPVENPASHKLSALAGPAVQRFWACGPENCRPVGRVELFTSLFFFNLLNLNTHCR
jgi:hypothetical protein